MSRWKTKQYTNLSKGFGFEQSAALLPQENLSYVKYNVTVLSHKE